MARLYRLVVRGRTPVHCLWRNGSTWIFYVYIVCNLIGVQPQCHLQSCSSETGHWSSLFKSLPAQLGQWRASSCCSWSFMVQWVARLWTISIFRSMGVPHCWNILQLGTYQGLEGRFSNLWGLCFNITLNVGPAFVGCVPINMNISAQVTGDIHPQVPDTADNNL